MPHEWLKQADRDPAARRGDWQHVPSNVDMRRDAHYRQIGYFKARIAACEAVIEQTERGAFPLFRRRDERLRLVVEPVTRRTTGPGWSRSVCALSVDGVPIMARKKSAKVAYRGPGPFVILPVPQLVERLALLNRVIPRRAVRKDCACYHFTVRPDGTATVAGTDLEVRAVVSLEVRQASGSGRFLIDAHSLNALLGAYVAPTIRFDLDVKDDVIQASGDTVRLALPSPDWAKSVGTTIEGPLTSSGWLVRGDEFARALERSMFATDPSSTRYALNGIALVFPEEGDTLEIVATDGRRLVRLGVRVARVGEPERLWRPQGSTASGLPILSSKALPTAIKIARMEGPRNLGLAVIPSQPEDVAGQGYGHGLLQVVGREATLTAVIPDGRFPNYQDVWPTETPQALIDFESATELRDFLAMAVVATDSESRAVEIVMAGAMLMLTVKSVTKGEVRLSLPVPTLVGRGTSALDALMLRQFLDQVEGEPLKLSFYSEKLPLRLDAPGIAYIQMPMGRDEHQPTPPPAPPVSDETPGDDQAEGDEGDEPEEDGDIQVAPDEPEPVAPVAATPEAHEGNGQAKHHRRK